MLSGTLPDSAPGGSWTYVLITPDALIADALTSLVDKLRHYGLEPRGGRLLRLDAGTMLHIYNRPVRSKPPALPPPSVFELWYSLGPSCVLLLHRDEGDASAAMLEAKGATDPRRARTDSIRHAGENTLMNLVHCPDDEDAANWELTQLFGDDALEMREAAARPDDMIRLLTTDSIGDALPACSGREALSVPLIVNKLRLRLVQRMALRSHYDRGALRMLLEVRQALELDRAEVAEVATSAGRLDVARGHNAVIHHPLQKVAGRCGEPAWTRAVLAMSALITGSPEGHSDAVAAVSASGLYISHTESVAVQVNAYAL